MTANGYGSRRAVTSWCMYDWANSAFTTLVVTFIYNSYFALTFVSDPDAGVALWARGVSISAIIIALLSPIAGAVADKSGRRRSYLIIATVVCAVTTPSCPSWSARIGSAGSPDTVGDWDTSVASWP